MFNRPIRQPNSGLFRPERDLQKLSLTDRLAHSSVGFLFRPWRNSYKSYQLFLPKIHARSAHLSALSDSEITLSANNLRRDFLIEGCTDTLLAQAFALIREASGRSVGMYHFDSQLLGGLVMFHGNVAEMQTGEGKTLAAILPAATAALASIPSHVITVNDYLAERDAETMRPVYEMLGLSVGCVVGGKTKVERQQAYGCDVTYCTNTELVFDYLKDLLVLKNHTSPLQLHGERLQGRGEYADNLMLRGLHFAVVDEADSVLLDEARTPLIISGEQEPDPEQQKIYSQAIEVARSLESEADYVRHEVSGAIELLPQGEERVDVLCRDFGPYWLGRIRRMELISKALMALYNFKLDLHYLIRDGKVQIIDEHTGRVMADRTWEQGLQQLIEAKEDCDFSKPRKTLARMSFQKFFRLYNHLGGMTGTATEVVSELWSVYSLPVVAIPSHKPSKRINLGSVSYLGNEEKLQAIVARIENLYSNNRAILVGTASVEASELLSQRLQHIQIPHQLLSARHDGNEAEIISLAGLAAKITIATSMAGRGTDIKLSTEVEENGGLHVILTEFHDASRIDRQLLGRCARMGDRGSVEVLVSLEDKVLKQRSNFWLLLQRLSQAILPISISSRLSNKLCLKALSRAQYLLEKQHARSRVQLLKEDENQQELLSFVGSKI